MVIVCDLAAILFASFWFVDFFKPADSEHTGGVSDVDIFEFVRVASLQSEAFRSLARDLMVWFPVASAAHDQANECSNRIAAVADALDTLSLDTLTWQISSKACAGLKVACHPPVATFVAESLTKLSKIKALEEREHFNTLVEKYPYIMHIYFPVSFPKIIVEDKEQQCDACAGVGWFWTANCGMENCETCEGTGEYEYVSPMPSLCEYE